MPPEGGHAHAAAGAGEVTRLLEAARAGDRVAFDAIYGLVYRELRRIAHGQRGHRMGLETLSTTALVSETYLKLLPAAHTRIQDRQHFFALAARAMRQILVDTARRGSAAKRGAELRVDLAEIEQVSIPAATRSAEMVALDAALTRLESLDERLARLVELRFFGGRSIEELATLLGISDRTVKRDWRRAKAFLQHELELSGFVE